MRAGGPTTADSDALFDAEAPVVEVDVDGFLCCCSLRHSGSAVTAVVAAAAVVVVTRNCLCCYHSCLLSWRKFRVGPPYLSCSHRLSVVLRLLSIFGAFLYKVDETLH